MQFQYFLVNFRWCHLFPKWGPSLRHPKSPFGVTHSFPCGGDVIYGWPLRPMEKSKNLFKHDIHSWTGKTVHQCNIAFFKRAWHKVKNLPRPWAAGSTEPLIRPLKWDTLRVWTPSGSGMTRRQIWKYEKKSVLVRKTENLTACHSWTTGSSDT